MMMIIMTRTAVEEKKTKAGDKGKNVVSQTELQHVPLLRSSGGRNSSVGSAWARCPQRRGFDPLGTFSVEGIFPLELTWVQTPFP